MERLTELFEGDYCCNASFEVCKNQKENPKDPDCCCDCEIHQKMTNKLGEYEDLEEQGLLLKLPCKIGDPVFATSYYYDCDFLGKCKESYKCEEEIHCEYLYKKYFVRETKFQIEMLSVLGKTIFTTKEEAEAALQAMKEEK